MEKIPRRVERFVADCIDSVGQLEILLLLRADPARLWSATEVSRKVHSERDWAELQLEYLCSQRLLVAERGPEPSYQYDPERAELDAVVGELSEAFAKQRVELVRLVFRQRPSDRLRAFAEAFKLRRER